MLALKIILTLLVSAVIGYATNYIAVKMLFKPLKPIYIGKHQLPFTPGIIPKGKPRLARALGVAVNETLLTDKDIENALLSDSAKKAVANEICMSLYMREDNSLKGILNGFAKGCTYDGTRQMLKSSLCEKITAGLKSADIAGIIVQEGSAAVKEKLSGGMLSMFINDDLIMSFTEPLGEKINEYIDGDGRAKVEELVENELCALETKTAPEIFTDLKLNEEKLTRVIGEIYTKLVSGRISKLLTQIDLKKLVEDKVNAMPVEDLETLVMSVMKHELNAVINLGALIGLIIGILNVVINL